MSWFLAGLLVLLASAPQGNHAIRQTHDAMGMALPDSATGRLVFHDLSGGRLLIKGVDYPEAFARETLCPDKVVLHGTAVRKGQYFEAFVCKLGMDYRTVENPARRSTEENIAYFRRLIEQNPNTMHYYAAFAFQALEGWFQVLEWDMDSVGTVRVFFHASGENGPFIAQLIQVNLNPVELSAIQRAAKDPYVLVRPGRSGVRWDFGQNILYMEGE